MKLGRHTAGRKRSNKVASLLLAPLFFLFTFILSLVFLITSNLFDDINSGTNRIGSRGGEKKNFFSHCKSVICFVPSFLLFFFSFSLETIQSLLNHVTNLFDEI